MNKKIKNNQALIAEIRKVKSNMDIKDIFNSNAYKQYLESQAKIALGKASEMRSVWFVIDADENSNFSACTDGNTIYSNLLCPLVRAADSLEDKDRINQAKMFHEIGHRFFTDFSVWNQVFSSLENGKWYTGTSPDHPLADKVIQMMQNDAQYCHLLCAIFHNITNIFEDEYIEWRMADVIGGEYLRSLQFSRQQLVNEQKTVSEMLPKIENGELEFVAFVCNSWLVLASHGELIGCEDVENHPIYLKLKNILEESEGFRKKLATEKNTIKRAKLCNELLCILSEYLKIPEENSQEDSNNVQNEDSLETKKDNILNQLNQGSQEAKGITSPVDVKKEKNESSEFDINKQDQQNNDKTNTLEQVFVKLAEDAIESEILESLQTEADQIVKQSVQDGYYVPWHYCINRKKDIASYENRYDVIYNKVKTISQRTKRMLKKILEDKKLEGVQNGYLMGRFNAISYIKHMYSKDGKAFSRNLLPNGQYDVTFGLLIDQSGSMSGKKNKIAIESAILFADVLSSINVPHIIVGHDTVDDDLCDLMIYHDFNTDCKKDKYRLVDIFARGRNRDGAAITYCCEKLKKQDERKKVLIVITDGEPTEFGFHQEENSYIRDTKKTISEYSKDISIFGAVIDGDMYAMKEMYGERVMDLRDLDKVPLALVTLLKRFIKR